ncbi:glutamine synthetase family protein [Streptomyces sp. NPDC060028]|uniref:glutamine synthetase family protein n=1 Tax=Streptomyces sp. NPDC060028 TaxID=3347041 RepID=UPI00369B7D41
MYARSWSRPYGEGGVGRSSFVAEFGIWNDEQTAAAEQIEAGLHDIDLVRVAFCDPHGLARSKTLTSQAFQGVLRNGMDFSPGPFIFDTGHAVAVDFQSGDPGIGVSEITGAGNFVLVPDPLTFQVLPGDGPRTAWILGDEYLRDGTPHPLSTRHVLKKIAARYTERDLTPIVGLEAEWYLTRRLDTTAGNVGNGFGLQGPAPAVEAVDSGYQFNGDNAYASVAAITNPIAMDLVALGLPLRSMEHESGPGQIETTFSPMTALDTADAMLLFRTHVKQSCARRGYHASFMSLPRVDSFDPSGWHLNQSVIDNTTGRNIFAADGIAAGISTEGKSYAEGLMDRARAYCLLSVPTVNGYRRLGAEHSLSPTRIGWSFEDRGAMIRVVGGGSSTHIENRVGEPCANPYLNIAAQLHAGLEGLTGFPGTTEPVRVGSAPDARAETLPQSLPEALEAFRSGPAADLLGKPLAACLIKLKESEAARYEAWASEAGPTGTATTEWEQREYFENF